MKHIVEQDSGKLRRIIYILLGQPELSEHQARQVSQTSPIRQIYTFMGHLIGGICLFIMLFGGLWLLPLVQEVLR